MRAIRICGAGAGLLVMALAIVGSGTSQGTGAPDSDLDGVPDAQDNCITLPNGPLAQWRFTPRCNDQEDGDRDGYGDPCDTDITNDGAFGLDDVALVYEASQVVSTDPRFDFNCDGATGLDDVRKSFDDSVTLALPGPSGWACAGSIPCP